MNSIEQALAARGITHRVTLEDVRDTLDKFGEIVDGEITYQHIQIMDLLDQIDKCLDG